MEQKLIQKIAHFKRLRWACRIVVMAATAVSVWANVLHSRPTIPAMFINVLPPLLVLGGFEMGSRVPHRVNARWYHKVPRVLSMVAITLFGAWLSYWHQHDAFLLYSGERQTAALLPLSIDGLMVIASVCVIDLNTRVVELEVVMESSSIRPVARPPKPELKPVLRTKKDRIVDLITRAPNLKIQEIADKTGASYNYVYTIQQDMKNQRARSDSELVTA